MSTYGDYEDGFEPDGKFQYLNPEPDPTEPDVPVPDIPEPDPEPEPEPTLVTVKKVRGPKVVRPEGTYKTGKEYEVEPEVAEILLGLRGSHGQVYFERV